MQVLSKSKPIAKKEHRCDFCGGVIRVGEKYEKQTIVDDCIYDFKAHDICEKVAIWLDMYDDHYYSDDGLSGEEFEENINEYVREHHYDDSTDDISEEWDLPFPELVEKVYQELKEKEKQQCR